MFVLLSDSRHCPLEDTSILSFLSMNINIRSSAETGGQRERAEGHHLRGSVRTHSSIPSNAPETRAERGTPDHGKYSSVSLLLQNVTLLESFMICAVSFRRCVDDSVSVCLGKNRKRYRNSNNTNAGKHTRVCQTESHAACRCLSSSIPADTSIMHVHDQSS